MPWCGYWGPTGFWWILPLIGLVSMGFMFFLCVRGGGCMGRMRRMSSCGRSSGERSSRQRELETSSEDVRKTDQQPS